MLKVQREGFPLLTTIHHPITSDLQIALNACKHWWEKLLIRRWHSFLTMQKKVAVELNHIVTVSERSYADIIESFDLKSDNIQLVYNGIDTKEFKPIDSIKRDRWQIMATASADQPLKGLRFLLLAFAKLTVIMLRRIGIAIAYVTHFVMNKNGSTKSILDKKRF